MKLSAILVKPLLPLRMLQPFELEILSRVLFQYFQGVDEQHNKRWRRWWGRMFKTDKMVQFYPATERDGDFHAMHMSFEGFVFENQYCFYSREAFRLFLKTGAAFGHFEAVQGVGLVFVPSSLAYGECSDDEMREFHTDAMEFLRTPQAQQTLWPEMSPVDRIVTFETLLLEWQAQSPNQPRSQNENSGNPDDHAGRRPDRAAGRSRQ